MDIGFRNRRMLRLALLFFISALFLAGRLAYLQLVCASELARAALAQRSLGVPWGQPRGDFLDKEGRLLTGRGSVWRAVFFPTMPGAREKTIPVLCSRLGLSSEWLEGIVRDGDPVKLPVNMAPYVRELQSMSLPGLVLAREPVRYGVPSAVHAIGYLSVGEGVCGLEYLFDDRLSGRASETLAAATDTGNRPIPGIGFRRQPAAPGMAGRQIVLTLDRDLQDIVEKAMDRVGMKGAVVAVDPRNGDVLAISSRPGFNPNNPAASLEATDAPFLNRAVLAFHPGSVFKIVIAAAALEEGLVSLSDRFYDPGFIDAGDTRFHCHTKKGHGELAFSEAMAVSCNPVFIGIGQVLGARTILETAERLGLGKLTGVGLREEAPGGLPGGWPLTPADVANLSIGQKGVFATPLQVAMLTAAVANGGILCRPRIVKEVRTSDGRVERRYASEQVGRVMKPSTASKLHDMLVQAVESGTGRAAGRVTGAAAGKTGTAETGRLDANGQSLNHAWFAGYAPIKSPRICVVVFAEEGDSGSRVATPLFAEIVEAYFELNPLDD